MRRGVVASPAYLARHGAPRTLADLADHACLCLSQQRGWSFRDQGETVTVKVSGALDCNDGAVLHEWALSGRGLAWRSMWEVGEDLRAGRLVQLLEDFAAPPIGIYAVFPQRRHLPLRVRLFIDLLKHRYGNPGYWAGAAETSGAADR
jgi:DNA-binding transcriptional LysR family regulator